MKVTDFNFRISQKLGLSYHPYDQRDSEAIRLLSSLTERKIPFSIEWEDNNQYSLFLSYGPIFQVRYSGQSLREAICKAFEDYFLSDKDN